MAEQPQTKTATKSDKPGGLRAIGMYDRPANAGRPSPLLIIGIVVILALLILAVYMYPF